MPITAAAVRDKNGTIYTDKSHGYIVRKMPPEMIRGSEEGFMTDTGEFVTREEAAKIAFDCGQIATPVERLRSDDLDK